MALLEDCLKSIQCILDQDVGTCDCLINLQYIASKYTEDSAEYWVQKYRELNRYRFHSIPCNHIWSESTIEVVYPMPADVIQKFKHANPNLPQQLIEVGNQELLDWCKRVGYVSD